MKPITQEQRAIANISTTGFKPFDTNSGGSISNNTGESYLSLDETQPPGGGFHIYRMAAGTTTTPHEHTCDEQFYVIEGELTDNDGFTYRKGDLVLLRKGTQHSSYSEHGCLLAVFITSPEVSV